MSAEKFEATFKEAIGWLVKQRKPDLDIVEVTSFEEDVQTDVGCPTCGPTTSTDLDVYYVTSEGKACWTSIYGSLSSLIPEIGSYPGWSK